jgi:hypothetical protein
MGGKRNFPLAVLREMAPIEPGKDERHFPPAFVIVLRATAETLLCHGIGRRED